ncbi:MAG TPA: hypothetical protein VFY60_12445 [Pyrinomonadaceae bacterium]|nr:hypothetical protein [Pyrinomonadaceae bacterium]
MPRTLTEVSYEDPNHAAQVELLAHVREQLRKLASGQNWFGCSCIAVKNGDGMSWDSEAVRQMVAREFFHIKRWPLTNAVTTGSLPLISQFVQLNTFLRLAIAHNLTESYFSFFSLRSWVLPGIFVFSILISFAIELLVSLRDVQLSGATVAGVFTDPKFYMVNAALLALGIASQALATFMSTRTKSSSLEKLDTRLRNIDPGNRSYDDFVDALAKKLQTVEFPRIVIVDDWEQLDATTRRVITRYFGAHAADRTGAEYWIIFEPDNEGERFSNLVLNNSGPGYKRTKLFRQLLLTPQEKLDLVRVLGKPADAAEYDVVSRICNAEDPKSGEVVDEFKKYRRDHPKKENGYDDLDFLFLLSLTVDNIPLPENFLLNGLSEKEGPRPGVLRLYLRRTNLQKEEFRNLFSGIHQNFRDVLIVDAERTKIKTIREKTDVLIKIADELGLDTGLGHLFWALFWHHKQPDPVEAVWLRKLTRHILNAETTSITNPATYVEVRMALFESALFCVDKCLKACLFSGVTAVISKASLLLSETDLPQDGSYEKGRARLLQRCWAAYTILGDEEILRVIVDLYETPGRGVNYHRESSLLEKMFFESMGLSPEKRRRINAELLERIYGRTEEDKPISDYVRARSSWLALAAGRLVNTDVCRFISALREADVALPQIAASSTDRIQAWLKQKQIEAEKKAAPAKKRPAAKKRAAASAKDDATKPVEDINLMDLMSLSLSLWCLALRFNPLFLEKRIYATNRSVDDPWDAIEALIKSQLSIDDFSQLIAAAENAALLASEVRRPGGEQSSEYAAGSDYLMSGLAKELCAVSLASVLTAERYATISGIELTEKHLRDLNHVIQLNASTLQYELPPVNSIDDLRAEALVTRVDSLMKLCGIIWRHFGTERLSDFMSIRRVVFSALCLPEARVKLPTHNLLLQSVGPVMNRNDFAGVMANLAISDAAATTSGALAANYAIHAADSALNGAFGKPIQDQLVLNAITSAHTHNYSVDPFVKHLLAAAPGQKSLLERLLLSLHTQDVPGAVLQWLNTANSLNNSNDAERVLNVLRDFAPSISDEEMRIEVESQLELFSLRQTLKKGQPVNAVELLANWGPRKHLWVYASVLRLLLENNYSEEQIKQESLAILDRVPEDDRYNSYLLLSVSLAGKLQQAGSTNGDLTVPMSYLVRSHPKWERDLSPSMNVRVYKTLYRWDPDNRDAYETEIKKWSVIDLEEDHLRHLPRLINLGNFFLIFRYYFDTLSFWGLQTDVSFPELSAMLSIAPEEKRSRAMAWKNNGGSVPQPLVQIDFRRVVNAEFLAKGSLVFDSPCGDDPEFQEHRAAFDQAARSGMDQLFSTIINLPRLPSAIRELLQDYSRMLSSNTLPGD